jgi:hypothetical protein
MSSNVVNQVPYLRTSRDFPQDIQLLTVQMNKAYVDIANSVNNRTISLFPTSRPALNGESWFLTGNQKQQGLRQVFTFTTTANIPHNLNLSTISSFSDNYGQFTDGTNWYGLINGSNVAIAGQISFYVTPSNIVFLTGAGAPTLTNGMIVLEWLSMK